MCFGVISFLDMNKDVNSYAIMLFAFLAGALIVISMVLHSTDINLGAMVKQNARKRDVFKKWRM